MGAATRALALAGLIVTAAATPRTSNGVGEASRWRGLSEQLPPSPKDESCWLRVILSGDLRGGFRRGCADGTVECDEPPVTLNVEEGYVQVFAGSAPIETGIARQAGTSAWRAAIDLGCVDGRDPLVLTQFSESLHILASCEVRRIKDLLDTEERLCSGADGSQFFYMVEHRNINPPLSGQDAQQEDAMIQRILQATPSPATSPPAAAPSEPDVTEPPTVDETPIPTATVPATVTDAPEPTPTDSPELQTTSEPTPEATPPSTAAVTDEPTPRPAAEPTPQPTSERTDAPRTAEPTIITDAPAPPTPEPTLEPTTPEPTPAPVGTTPEPTIGGTPLPNATPEPRTTTPAPTSSPVSVVSPTANPNAAASTDSPVPPGTPAPVTPAPATQAPTPQATTEPTSATMPSTLPPDEVKTPSPSKPPTVAPVSPTLSPATTDEELCTDDCNSYPQDNKYVGAYYDVTCNGEGNKTGCNLDPLYTDCRKCFIDSVSYGEDNSEMPDWPECPCCVATEKGFEPVTDVCIAEANSETPAPTPPMESINLDAENPKLMVMEFNNSDCSASGIAFVDDSMMQIAKYSDVNGACTASGPFGLIYGTVCDSEDVTYSWNYDSDGSTYGWNWNGSCTDPSTTVRRTMRRLEEGVSAEKYDNAKVLCNDGDRFFALFSVADAVGGTAVVYAEKDTQGYENATAGTDMVSNSIFCVDANEAMSQVLSDGPENLLSESTTESSSSEDLDMSLIIIVAASVVVLALLIGFCCFCYRRSKGKEGRADQMRRNLGYTPDMESKGEGNFGPTNKHVAITRGDRAKPTPDMLQTKSFQPNYSLHQRAPSEAPSSVIEDNIANNYRPKKAQKSWEKRKIRKELTKPPTHQHVISAGPTSEELKTENVTHSTRSEHLSEHSLTQLEARNTAHPSAAQAQYGYAFESGVDGEEDMDEDDDARSAATGMSGPSKYAPSGYAPSSHHGGVTHDLMSQYEPSVYEADSTYDPSLYGRESEYGDESSYSYADARSSHRGGYSDRGGGRGGGRFGAGHHVSGRASVADTAAMSHLGSVMEMDDGRDGGNSAYAPSDSYVSSYVSSEDDDGRPARSIHPRGMNGDPSPTSGYSSRHNTHRSGREISGGRSGFSQSTGGSSSRHSGARSGFEGGSRDYDDDDNYHGNATSMQDVDYFGETGSSQMQGSKAGAGLTNVDENSASREVW